MKGTAKDHWGDRRSRGWLFTEFKIERLEKISLWLDEMVKKNKITYAIIGMETCPSTEKDHLQGYVHYTNAHMVDELCELMPNTNMRPADGSPYDNFKYCSEDGEFEEWGTRPKGKGKRTDIQLVRETLLRGDPISKVWMETSSYQALRFGEAGLKYLPAPVREQVEVIWIWGPTGVGKTRLAISICEDAKEPFWMSSKNLKWWDGYTDEKYVIFDDFRKDFCTFHELLRILDRYPFRVEVKGGSTWLNARTIIITSCFHPLEVYETREDLQQLIRRISHIEKIEHGDWVVNKGCAPCTEVGGNTSCCAAPLPKTFESMSTPSESSDSFISVKKSASPLPNTIYL